jgi:hypothetical protein
MKLTPDATKKLPGPNEYRGGVAFEQPTTAVERRIPAAIRHSTQASR